MGYSNYFLPGIVLIVLMASYYIYIVEFAIEIVDVEWQRIIYIVFCHVLFIPVMWSFFDIMLTNVAEIPDSYRLSNHEHGGFMSYNTEAEGNTFLKRIVDARGLVLYAHTSLGYIRYCMDCKLIKPDRAHHCSQCDVCVLKMDHHCPWVNNCIGFHNYKCFVLFLMYLSLYATYFVLTILNDFLVIWERELMRQIPVFVGFTVGVFVIMLSMFFFAYHVTLIIRNETTLENMYPPYLGNGDVTFDLGWKRNIEEVFGDQCWLWCLPVFSSLGSGYEFEMTHVERQ